MPENNEWKSFRKESLVDYGSKTEVGSFEALKIGALLRIADAVEKTADGFKTVLGERDYFKREMDKANQEQERLARVNRALRGRITVLKRRKS